MAEPELPCNVYCFDPHTGKATVVIADMVRPNGLCFSPDERLLYVVESGTVPRQIRVFDVGTDGRTLSNSRLWIDLPEGHSPDGFRCDQDGNIWAGWGTGPGLDGVRVFAPEGTPIGHIHLPERCANLCFGGAKGNRLFMAASQSLYALYVNARSAVTL